MTKPHRTMEKFFATAEIDQSGCWLYRGHREKSFYPLTTWRGRRVKVHRLSYELSHGPIPDGLSVLHRCDTPSCINPDHLTAGTHAENMRDASQRRRFPDRRGAGNNLAKISSEIAEKIRSEHVFRKVTAEMLATRYGLSTVSVYRVLHGKTWATKENANA